MSSESLLRIENLAVSFVQGGRENKAVHSVSFEVKKGHTLAIVGESGSGKSVTAQSILRLLPEHTVRYPSGTILYQGRDLLHCSESEIRAIRGNRIGMIFQEPMTSLNPLHTIEKQIRSE